jgi:hypothetical protein
MQLTSQVNYSSACDAFQEALSAGLEAMASSCLIRLDAPIASMLRIRWGEVENVGDTSAYVGQVGIINRRMRVHFLSKIGFGYWRVRRACRYILINRFVRPFLADSCPTFSTVSSCTSGIRPPDTKHVEFHFLLRILRQGRHWLLCSVPKRHSQAEKGDEPCLNPLSCTRHWHHASIQGSNER